jgi:hypothetical protein
LSWGGPADYFEIDFSEEGEIEEGRYIFQDWNDGATKTLDIEDAEKVAEVYGVSLDC